MVNHRWLRRTILMMTLALTVGVLVGGAVHSKPVAAGGETVEDRMDALKAGRPLTGAPPRSDLIVWRGTNCQNRELYVRLNSSSSDAAKSALIQTLNDATCTQVASPIATESAGVSPLVVNAGYIATSHTLQDIVRIDVAWFRTSTLRSFDGTKVWLDPTLGKQIAWLDGGPGWWPTKTPPHYYYANFDCPTTGFCSEAATIVEGSFHTDFLHCNAINQDIRLVTDIYAYDLGDRTVEFYKYGSCPGVYSATGDRFQSDSGGYGGQTAGALYTCAQPPGSNPPRDVPCDKQLQ